MSHGVLQSEADKRGEGAVTARAMPVEKDSGAAM
jgi:hypothetical protein